MTKDITFEGYSVECWFNGEQWFNGVPLELAPDEQDAWELRLMNSDVWDNLYKLTEAAE